MVDIQRCDIRVPQDLYDEITEIAEKEFNAPRYHKTGKVQVSSTIIELIKLGIANLRGEAIVSDKVSDIHRVVNEAVESKLKDIGYSSDIIPDNLGDRDSASFADRIETIVDEKLENAIAQCQQKLFASVREELEPILVAEKEMRELSANDYFIQAVAEEVTKIITPIEPERADDANTTERLPDENEPQDPQKLSQSESPIEEVEAEKEANLEENLPTQIDKASLDLIFDEEEEEESADWNKLKTPELRKIITMKGLGMTFREKLGKAPRAARKAELVKFLESN